MQHMNCLIIAILLSGFIFKVELKTNGSIGQTKPDFKQYARENWVDFEKEVQQFTKWLNRSDAHADEVVEVLLYISRLDEPIYVGVELLKALDGSEKLLKQIRKIAKSSSVDDHRSGSAVAFMFGTSGVVPLYVKVKSDEETMVEHLEMGKLIKHIVMSAQKHRSNRKRKLFHKIVEELFSDIKSVTKWSSDMLKRIVRWDESVKERLHHLTLKKVAVGLKDVALWLTSPAHVADIVQIILYFTNLSGPIKISLEVISALGLDGTFTKIAAKMGVKLAENGVNRKVSMWMFGPNGVLPLFVRQGEKVDSEELMDSIDRANVWYYYKKEQIGANQLNIRCNLKILDEANEGGERSCAWKVRQKPEQAQEQLLEQMEEHMQSEHPVKYGDKLNAQREKEEIIRRADIWHYFQKDQQQNGYVNCKLHIATERSGKVTQKCNWKIEIGKANESELNDHLSLEHLPEFEQRLKAMRKKELPIRHIHDEPLTNSLTLFQRLTVSLVLYKGRPMDQLVDIVLERLHNWERLLLKKWKRRWERVKRIQFRDVREAFKHAAMWLITPKHINNVLKVIFIITKLDTPIFLTVEVMKAFGIQRHIVKKLDKASLKIKKRYEGTTLEKSLLFMIGEGGVVRLFLDADSSVAVQDASANVKKNDLSLSGTAEFLHTVIMTVVNNQGSKAHALAFLVMDKLRDLRLELSLVRGWNSNWPQIEERYNKIKDELKAERIEKIGRESVRLNGEEFGDRPRPQQTEGESSDVSVEIGSNSFNSDESSYIDIAILTGSGSNSSDEHSVVFDSVLLHEPEPIIVTGSDSSDEHSVVFDSVLHESEPTVDERVQSTIPSPKMNGNSSNGKHDALQLQQPKQKTKHKSANGFKKLMGLCGIIVHKQSDEVYQQQQMVKQQQQSVGHLQGNSAVGQPLKESMASLFESDERSVIVEQPDCPGKMEGNLGHIQFAELLVRSDGDKCKTVQILSQKIKVVEDFLDEAIKTIKNAESEGDVPPVINLRLDNHIPLKKQRVLKKINAVNVMFLYYKMGQAGITFDCDSSDRPREYAFNGPKDKLFVLLLPACAEKSGKIGQFAIFRADYFDEVEIKIE